MPRKHAPEVVGRAALEDAPARHDRQRAGRLLAGERHASRHALRPGAIGDKYLIRGAFPTSRDEQHHRRLHARQPAGSALPDDAARRADRRATTDVGRRAARVVPQSRHRQPRRSDAESRPGLEQQLLRMPRLGRSEGIRRDSESLRDDLDGLRDELRALPRSGRGARRRAMRPRATPTSGPSAIVVPTRLTARTIIDGVRAVSFASGHHGAGIHRGRRLLRSLRSGARVRAEERQGSRVLARRPAAPLLERRHRILAERLLCQRWCELHDMSHRSA